MPMTLQQNEGQIKPFRNIQDKLQKERLEVFKNQSNNMI